MNYGPLKTLAAGAWFAGLHLPYSLGRYYGRRALNKARFGTQRGSAAALSPAARTVVADFQREGVAASSSYLSASNLSDLEQLLSQLDARETQRQNVLAVQAAPNRSAYFSSLQFELSPEARKQLWYDVLPPDFIPMMEHARGRRLTPMTAVFQRNDPRDTDHWPGTSEPLHPFHVDGSPQYAKCIIYLTDVDEDCGPFQIIPGSRFAFPDELMRLSLQPGAFTRYPDRLRKTIREALPQGDRVETHFWDAHREDVERRFGPVRSMLGPAGTTLLFDGMNVHCGNYEQRAVREVIQMVFL